MQQCCLAPVEAPVSLFKFVASVSDHFGHHFSRFMVSTYIGLKGILMTLVSAVQLPYFKALGRGGVEYQRASVIAMSPWAMKGFIGVISDACPIFGYHKRPYLVAVGVIGPIAILVLALLPTETPMLATFAPFLFLFVHFQVATTDLLCEGKYVELLRQVPETKGDVVTFVWMCTVLGTLIGSSFVGPLSDAFGTPVVFFLCFAVSVQALVPALLGWMPEERKRSAEHSKLQAEKLKTEMPLFLLASVMATAALAVAISTAFGVDRLPLIVEAVSALTIGVLAFRCLPRLLAECNLFMFLQEVLYINLSGSLDYWYTAGEDCVPGGPAFNYTYYQTYTHIVGGLAACVGLWIFQTVLTKWRYRPVFLVTTLIRVFASVFDIIILKRWNLLLGVGDKMMYLLGDAVIVPISSMMAFMPAVLLTSKLCPPNMEATVYAILAGFTNFGGQISKSVGAVLMDATGINTEPPHCDFSNLVWVVVVGHLVAPLLTVFFVFCLIPDADFDTVLLEHQPQPTSPSSPSNESSSSDDIELEALVGATD